MSKKRDHVRNSLLTPCASAFESVRRRESAIAIDSVPCEFESACTENRRRGKKEKKERKKAKRQHFFFCFLRHYLMPERLSQSRDLDQLATQGEAYQEAMLRYAASLVLQKKRISIQLKTHRSHSAFFFSVSVRLYLFLASLSVSLSDSLFSLSLSLSLPVISSVSVCLLCLSPLSLPLSFSLR